MPRYHKTSAPRAETRTERRRLLDSLGEEPLNARELSQLTSMSEKDVYANLPHIEKTLRLQGKTLVTIPAICQKCDFEFERGRKFKRPSRCPECRHERIIPPEYSISE